MSGSVADARLEPPTRRTVLLAWIASLIAGGGLYFAQATWQHATPTEVALIALAGAAGSLAVLGWERFTIALPLSLVATLIAPTATPALWILLFLYAVYRRGRGMVVAAVLGEAVSIGQTLLYTTRIEGVVHLDVVARQFGFGVSMVIFALGGGWLAGQHLRSQAKIRELVLQAARTEAALGDAARREERHRLSRVVHDGLGSRATLLNLYSQVVLSERTPPDDHAAASRVLAEQALQLSVVIRQTIDTLAAHQFREPSAGSLDDTITAFRAALRDVGIDFHASVDPSALNLPDGLYEVVVGFVREALTNTLKHGAAGRAELTVRLLEGRTEVSMRNAVSARAASQHPDSSGEGLRRLAAEAQHLGAEFTYTTEAGGAFTRLCLPRVS